MSRFPILNDGDAWQLLPASKQGRPPLPVWARMLAGVLPRTTAAMLSLDHAHRACSPLDPALRAAMRLTSARVNLCDYAAAVAAADARRAGLSEDKLAALGEDGYPGWSFAARTALQFASEISLRSDLVSDELFAELVQQYGERQTASMVLLLAHANFQDRLLLCLGAEIEPQGPMSTVDWSFDPAAFVGQTTAPPPLQPAGSTVVATPHPSASEPTWSALTYDDLQQRLEAQRQRPTRLRVPAWDEFAQQLPAELAGHPNDVVWCRIVFGYAPELAVPFELLLRTAGAETSSRWNRVFAQSLFWITTRAIHCPYCMGHCEMNWEVAGLNTAEITERSRQLASDDWSCFPPEEQQAFAFARKLNAAPWSIDDADIDRLRQGFGSERAMIVVFNACRHHYMTRISNGFQLTLERENVFFDYFNVPRPATKLTR